MRNPQRTALDYPTRFHNRGLPLTPQAIVAMNEGTCVIHASSSAVAIEGSGALTRGRWVSPRPQVIPIPTIATDETAAMLSAGAIRFAEKARIYEQESRELRAIVALDHADICAFLQGRA